MSFADTYLQPDAPDPVLDPALVLSIVHDHAPEAKAVTAVDETGGEARTYAIDDDLILKTQRPHRLRPRTSLAKEAFFLNQLAAVAPSLPVPRVLGSGNTGDVEYTCMTRMPGVALAHAKLTPPSRADALRAAGHVIRQIHSIDQQPFLTNELFPGDTRAADFPGRVNATLERLFAQLMTAGDWPADLAPDHVMARASAAAPADTPPVTLHSNPGPEHVFVDPATGAFTGLIDFGDAYRSHPALDARTWVSPADSRNILDGYARDAPVPPTFLNAWHLAQIIQELGLAARGRRATSEAATAVRRLLEALS